MLIAHQINVRVILKSRSQMWQQRTDNLPVWQQNWMNERISCYTWNAWSVTSEYAFEFIINYVNNCGVNLGRRALWLWWLLYRCRRKQQNVIKKKTKMYENNIQMWWALEAVRKQTQQGMWYGDWWMCIVPQTCPHTHCVCGDLLIILLTTPTKMCFFLYDTMYSLCIRCIWSHTI